MPDNGYAKPVLVSTEWLADHLKDPGLVVAEVDENPDLYDEGHIPGAVKLHWREDLQDPVVRDLVEKEAFERLLGERGISNDTALVLYCDKNNWFAAYAYWYLKIYGHSDVRIVDGGRQ
jgi:thiosulfate/3-mercaptopyruvate sulfurtransferase